MKKIALLILCTFVANNLSRAQDTAWTLERCIVYAKANNLSIQQSELQERVAQMQQEQSRLSALPGISLSSSYGANFGRSINPTTNNFVNTSYNFTGLNGSANVLLFGWFRTKNAIRKSDLLHKASEASLSQMQRDIALNTATGYLRILLAKEQTLICINQTEVSNKQVRQTLSFINAGRSNGLELAQVRTQLSNDSTAYFKAELDLQQSFIDLKALLNMRLDTPFDIAAIPDRNTADALSMLNPEMVFEEASSGSYLLRGMALKKLSIRKDIAIAKSNLYPQLHFSASSGTNYSSTYNEYLPTGETRLMPWGKQLQNNFSQSIYIGLSIPVFNGLATQYAIKQAKAAEQQNILEDKEVRLKLKQDIYKACNDVKTAFQTYKASQNTITLTETAHDFAQKRYDKGLISAMDLLLAQNASFKAQADAASAKYDLIFKLLVIDYYLGRELK